MFDSLQQRWLPTVHLSNSANGADWTLHGDLSWSPSEAACAAPATDSMGARSAILVFWLRKPQVQVLFVETMAGVRQFTWLPAGCSLAIANHKGAALAVADVDSSAASSTGVLHAGWAMTAHQPPLLKAVP